MAFYVIPHDEWYLIPIGDIARNTRSITLRPGGKYDDYRQAWHHLREARPQM